MATLSNVIGFDDAPFARAHRGKVLVVGTVCARTRLDGIVSTWVTRDGSDATDALAAAVQRSQFGGHLQAVVLQGIAVAGFNVIDVHALHDTLSFPVLVVARKKPDHPRIKGALATVRGGAKKWALIEAAGPMEALGGLWVQRVGLSRSEAGELLKSTTLHGALPEPIRLAHLIAGGVTTGKSRGRA